MSPNIRKLRYEEERTTNNTDVSSLTVARVLRVCKKCIQLARVLEGFGEGLMGLSKGLGRAVMRLWKAFGSGG